MDLSKLTPAPWESVATWKVVGSETGEFILARGLKGIANFAKEADGDFAALARNAFDVLMRRRWFPNCHNGKWRVESGVVRLEGWIGDVANPIEANDPFTALVEADKWYRENVEGKLCPTQA